MFLFNLYILKFKINNIIIKNWKFQDLNSWKNYHDKKLIEFLVPPSALPEWSGPQKPKPQTNPGPHLHLVRNNQKVNSVHFISIPETHANPPQHVSLLIFTNSDASICLFLPHNFLWSHHFPPFFRKKFYASFLNHSFTMFFIIFYYYL